MTSSKINIIAEELEGKTVELGGRVGYVASSTARELQINWKGAENLVYSRAPRRLMLETLSVIKPS
jgi:hypothetical protein